MHTVTYKSCAIIKEVVQKQEMYIFSSGTVYVPIVCST